MSFYAHPEYTLGVQVKGTAHSYRLGEFSSPVFVFGQRVVDRALWDAELSELTIDENGRVSQWNDATVGGRHLLQPDPNKRGVLVPSAMNGRDVIRFNGIEECMAFVGSLFAPGEFGAVYVVGRYWTPTPDEDAYIFNIASATGQIAYHKVTPDEDFKQAIHYDDGAAGAFDAAYYEKSNDNPWLFSMYMQAGNPVAHRYGTDRIGGFATPGFSDRATGDNTLTVGAAAAGVGHAHVDIASILVVGSATPAEDVAVEAFYQQRFGLTTPAVVLATPEDITAIFSGAELEAAYIPDASTMTLDGADVDVWEDQSGNGHDMAPIGTRNPTWVPGAGPNQAGEVQFDKDAAAAPQMLEENIGMGIEPGDRPSILVVGRFHDADAGIIDQVMVHVRKQAGGGGSLVRVYQDAADDLLTVGYSADDGGGGSTFETAKPPVDMADHHLMGAHVFAAGAQGEADGELTAIGSSAAISSDASGNDRLLFGVRTGIFNGSNCAITEVVVLNAEPTADQLERYRRRVALLYGLADAAKGV